MLRSTSARICRLLVVTAACLLAAQLLATVATAATHTTSQASSKANGVTDSVPGWSAQDPVYPIQGGLESVSCPSASFCMAVDSHRNLVTYDGSSWTVPQSFDQAAAEPPTSVSCSSATFCVATDWVGDALDYDGTSWSTADPLASGDTLVAVSCAPLATFCAAIDDEGNALTYDGSTVYSFDGTNWSAPTELQPYNALTTVSCASAVSCVVGDDDNDTFILTGTTTALSFSSPAPVVGQSISVAANVDGPATGPGASTPAGMVSISDGASSCQAPLAGSNGAATGTCSFQATKPGVLTFLALYYGSGALGSSASTQTVDVGGDGLSVGLSATSTSETYGGESAERFSAIVSPGSKGTPTGTVKVEAGSKALCTITLAGGAGSCVLAAAVLLPGTYSVVARYGGSGAYAAANSPVAALAILTATSATTLTLSSPVERHGDEEAEKFTVTVNPEYMGKPTGSVEIESGATKLCAVKLAGGIGTCSPSAGALKVGAHAVIGVYGGSSGFYSSESTSATWTVEVSAVQAITLHPSVAAPTA